MASLPGFYQDTGGASVEHKIPLDKTIYFLEERNQGVSGSGTKNLDLTTGNKILVTMDGNPTFTFTDPFGATNIMLRFVNGDGAAHTPVWPANMKWPSGVPPVLSTGIGAIDIIAIYFDGTDYYGNYSLNFL